MENQTAIMAITPAADASAMVAVVRSRLAAVRDLLKHELKGPSRAHPNGVDYGSIPGTDKLCLLQPGAEKIALMFQFSPSYTMQRNELPGGHLEVVAVCTLTHSPTGQIVGQAEGMATTMESKHRYRGAAGKACPECGAVACIPSKKEYGGGYFCKETAGGCGKKWKPGTPEAIALDKLPSVRTENPDPADQRNTVCKIAQKRAYVSAVKCASAASEVFTVDLEDAEAEPAQERPPVEMPMARAPEAKQPAQDAELPIVATGQIEEIRQSSGTRKDGAPWTRWGIKVAGRTFGTFDSAIAADASEAKDAAAFVTIAYTTDAQNRDSITTLTWR
jgi:hypothetical protein